MSEQLSKSNSSKTKLHSKMSRRFIIPLLGLSSFILLSPSALAEPTGYNQVSFNVEASEEVENDEINATLYKKVQSKNPNALATQLNTALNQALSSAKRYPMVTATTGNQNTYPQYDDDGKIIGWTGTVSINLTSKDFAKAGELIASLQNNMLVQNISFSISNEKKKQVEQELTKEASKEFQQQAKSLVETWDASGYQVISVSLNTNGGYGPRPVMAMARDASFESSPAPQNFEGGNTQVSVTASGTIELIPWR